ncbi:MAG: CRISPR-associated endonuclease Cas1 [Pseudomonadota bacterium]
MQSLYVSQQGAQLGLTGGRMTLTQNKETVADVPAEQVERIFLYGHVSVTPALLAHLLGRGIPTTLLSQSGYFRGQIVGGINGQVRRRAAQYALLAQPDKALSVIRELIAAKLDNQHRHLYLKLGGEAPAISHIRALIESVRTCDDLDRLRGLEGSAARWHFGAFPALLAETGFDFPGRHYHPPRDPVNALLSLGYSLLLSELQTGLVSLGLDPYVGLFHATDGRQPACVLDLMEPLRTLVDRLVLRLLRQGTLHTEDFSVTEEGCRLVQGRGRLFYTAWEELLASEVNWQDQTLSYRRLILVQSQGYVRWLEHPESLPTWFRLHDLGR